MTVEKITEDHQNQWKEKWPVNCGVKLLNLESNFPFMLGMMIPQH